MIGVSIFFAVVAVNINLSQNKVVLSELALENIEALAENESGSNKPCTVIGYSDEWDDGCLYHCAKCAEGFYRKLYLIRCTAR